MCGNRERNLQAVTAFSERLLATPLDNDATSGISLEFNHTPGHRKFLCLYHQSGQGYVLRDELRLTRIEGKVLSKPLWTGGLPCPVSYVNCVMERFSLLGFWEIDHLEKREELIGNVMGGAGLVLRAVRIGPPASHQLEFCDPLQVHPGPVEQMVALTYRLLGRSRRQFERKFLWHRLGISRRP